MDSLPSSKRSPSDIIHWICGSVGKREIISISRKWLDFVKVTQYVQNSQNSAMNPLNILNKTVTLHSASQKSQQGARKRSASKMHRFPFELFSYCCITQYFYRQFLDECISLVFGELVLVDLLSELEHCFGVESIHPVIMECRRWIYSYNKNQYQDPVLIMVVWFLCQ